MVAAYTRQRLAVIDGQKLFKRDGTRSNAVHCVALPLRNVVVLIVLGEQLDSHTPECFAMPNDPHRTHHAGRTRLGTALMRHSASAPELWAASGRFPWDW